MYPVYPVILSKKQYLSGKGAGTGHGKPPFLSPLWGWLSCFFTLPPAMCFLPFGPVVERRASSLYRRKRARCRGVLQYAPTPPVFPFAAFASLRDIFHAPLPLCAPCGEIVSAGSPLGRLEACATFLCALRALCGERFCIRHSWVSLHSTQPTLLPVTINLCVFVPLCEETTPPYQRSGMISVCPTLRSFLFFMISALASRMTVHFVLSL